MHARCLTSQHAYCSLCSPEEGCGGAQDVPAERQLIFGACRTLGPSRGRIEEGGVYKVTGAGVSLLFALNVFHEAASAEDIESGDWLFVYEACAPVFRSADSWCKVIKWACLCRAQKRAGCDRACIGSTKVGILSQPVQVGRVFLSGSDRPRRQEHECAPRADVKLVAQMLSTPQWGGRDRNEDLRGAGTVAAGHRRGHRCGAHGRTQGPCACGHAACHTSPADPLVQPAPQRNADLFESIMSWQGAC